RRRLSPCKRGRMEVSYRPRGTRERRGTRQMGWDFSISRTIDVLARTAPFIVFRILVYAGVVLAYVIATGGGAGIGWGIGAIGDPDFQSSAVFWGGVIGFGLVSGILYFAR